MTEVCRRTEHKRVTQKRDDTNNGRYIKTIHRDTSHFCTHIESSIESQNEVLLIYVILTYSKRLS